jgi:hypothetical protein
MVEVDKIVTTVRELLGVDVVEHKGLVFRFLSEDGAEHHVQLPAAEAHGLVDMIAIVARRLPKQKEH